MQITVPKCRGVSGCFYTNVVLKKKKKMRKRSLACLFVTRQCSSPQIKTVAQFLKSEKVNVLLHPPYRPGRVRFFLFPKLKKTTTKKNKNTLPPPPPAPHTHKTNKHLSGRRYRSRSTLGSAIHQFLMGVPKDGYKILLMCSG